MLTELHRKWLQVLGLGQFPQASTAEALPDEGDTNANELAKLLTSVNAIKVNAAPITADDASGPQENQLQLLFEQKTLQDKLNEPKSYPGREADEARLEQIRRKLGQSANQSTAPAPKDPRVAELARESRRELSEELDPDTGSLLDRKLNGKMIEEYYEIRREIQENYLDNIDAQNNTSKDIGEAAMKAWAKAIYDVGSLRRILASNVTVQDREALEEQQKRLQGLNNDLRVLKEKNKRVEQEVERIEKLMGAVKWAGYLLELNDALETFGSGVEGVSKIPIIATNAATVLSNSDMLRASHKIEKGIENLAKYPVQLAVAAEGFASVEELEKAINRKVEDIKDNLTMISFLIRHGQRAQKIYDTQSSEIPKK